MGEFILVRHGGSHYRVHPCQLLKVNRESIKTKDDFEERKNSGSRKANKDMNQAVNHWKVPPIDFDEDKDTGDDEESDKEVSAESDDNDSRESENQNSEESSNSQEEDQDHELNSVVQQMNRLSVAEDLDRIHENGIQQNVMNKVRPKPKTHIKYNLGDESFKGRVLSSQPKRTGTNKNWVNIHVYGEDHPSSIDWMKVTS